MQPVDTPLTCRMPALTRCAPDICMQRDDVDDITSREARIASKLAFIHSRTFYRFFCLDMTIFYMCFSQHYTQINACYFEGFKHEIQPNVQGRQQPKDHQITLQPVRDLHTGPNLGV